MALRPVKKYITIGENTGEGSTMEHWDRLWPGGYTFAYADGLFRPSTDTFLLGAFPRLRRGMTRDGRLVKRGTAKNLRYYLAEKK